MTETIREAVKQSGLTLYRVSKETGIPWSTVKRFVSGEKLRSDHVDALAEYFGYELTKPRPDKRKGG